MRNKLINQIGSVEKIANYSKIGRFLNNPIKYIHAIFHRKFIYSNSKKEKIIATDLFWGSKMQIALPASTDIYLTGGKSHSSEIRLAKFIILNMTEGSHFLDIGAHYGYFTLLASHLVGNSGKIMSFEPAENSHKLLSINTKNLKNTSVFKLAVSKSEGTLVFYEFPNLHSEYNSSDVSQFENEAWFTNSKPIKVEVQATTIDAITGDKPFYPQLIKIDVEGGEYDVIKGGINYLKNYAPKIIMEYLEPNRKNESHKKALDLLLSIGYTSNLITKDGETTPIDDIDGYLIRGGLESDNIVFIKM
jgi:FkbM family methyltransferase